MKTFLICHNGSNISQLGLPRWLASFSNLAGIIVLHERKKRVWRRIKREIKRVGPFRFTDVLLFRLYYRLFLSANDAVWEKRQLETLYARYPEIPADTPVLHTWSPNNKEAEEFITRLQPDVMIARCKTLLAKRIFKIPRTGTFVMHPGICPEYRNAHGCFWALANNDPGNVGMTLLKIDEGVDTGPIYGYYSYDYDPMAESHVVIQQRVVLDNLDAIRDKLIEIHNGTAATEQVENRPSNMWGQPWLTAYFRIRRSYRQGSA